MSDSRSPLPTATTVASAQASGVSRWAWVALYAACSAILLSTSGRYLPPAGDRFVDFLSPGAADLIPTVNAANALLHEENPYHARQLFVADPYASSRGAQQGFTYLYPPSHALLYVPLTWTSNGNYQVAIRLQLAVSLVCIGLLSWMILHLLGAVVRLERAVQLALFPVFACLLALNPGDQLGLERGQSDLITAAFAWFAVVAFFRRWSATAAFFAVASVLLKGYGIVLAAGLLALGVRQNWRRTLFGAMGAFALLLAPVVKYVPDAVQAYKIRSEMFWSSWTNQGFANLSHVTGLPREPGRLGLTFAALSCAALAWFQLARISRRVDVAWKRALWLAAFATAALGAVLGYSLNSIAYNAVIVMPGALVLAIGQHRLVDPSAARLRTPLGLWLAFALFGLFVFDLGVALGFTSPIWHLPACSAGQAALVMAIGVAAGLELAKAARSGRNASSSTMSRAGDVAGEKR